MKNEKLEAALSYVRRGWETFPVPPGTKAGYSKDKHLTDEAWGKTKSVADVRKYWLLLPQANIGIPMGIGSGIFDIECDTVEGHANLAKDGAASLAELEAKHSKLPPTLSFISPSGSVHRLYRHPGGDVRIRSGALGAEYPGIDIKGDGGMSVAPPSRTRKGRYEWVNDLPIADAPAWLLGMVITAARAGGEQIDVWEQFARTTRQADIAALTLAMAMIPNGSDVERKRWVDVGLALWSATGGSEEGYQIFWAWSRRWPGCNEEKTRKFWDTVKTKAPARSSIGPSRRCQTIWAGSWRATRTSSNFSKNFTSFCVNHEQ
jgi:Bifunctional DNA primase/polymerase, N-terminal/Primase C terminal 2 (PriCT-2)